MLIGAIGYGVIVWLEQIAAEMGFFADIMGEALKEVKTQNEPILKEVKQKKNPLVREDKK